jgi:hypothetical protein
MIHRVLYTKAKGLKETITNDSEGVMFGPSNNTKKYNNG